MNVDHSDVWMVMWKIHMFINYYEKKLVDVACWIIQEGQGELDQDYLMKRAGRSQ